MPGKFHGQEEPGGLQSIVLPGKKEKKVKSLSCVQLFGTPWTVAYQAPLSMGKNTGAGCHFLLQEIFLTQGLNLGLPHCRQTDTLPSEPPGKGHQESDTIEGLSTQHKLLLIWNVCSPVLRNFLIFIIGWFPLLHFLSSCIKIAISQALDLLDWSLKIPLLLSFIPLSLHLFIVRFLLFHLLNISLFIIKNSFWYTWN